MTAQRLCPQTIDEATQLLAQHANEARVIAGGSDLLPEIDQGTLTPNYLIDLGEIPNLDYIREDGDHVRLGARVTHDQIIQSELAQRLAPLLVRACSMFSDADIRKKSTVVGNIASGLSTNLTVAALWAMGAEVKLKSVRGERTVTFNDFFKGVRQTVLAPDELIVEIAFSKMSPKDKGAFVATGWSRDEASPQVTVAVVLEFDGDEISNAWINIGGVAPTVVNAIEAEQSLVGQWLSDVAIDEAADLAMNAVVTNPDATEIVRELVGKAMREIRDS
ncbi:MAG: FAD binding domain-containing protein [Chloroflexi bacterium]|nr:FAD binding domain-containing protein [Chloroflexota bacterium]